MQREPVNSLFFSIKIILHIYIFFGWNREGDYGFESIYNLNKSCKDLLPLGSRPIIHILRLRNPPPRIQIRQCRVHNLCLPHKLIYKIQRNCLEPREPSAQQSLRPRIPRLLIFRIFNSLFRKLGDRRFVGDGEVETGDDTTDRNRHGQVMPIGVTPRLVR